MEDLDKIAEKGKDLDKIVKMEEAWQKFSTLGSTSNE